MERDKSITWSMIAMAVLIKLFIVALIVAIITSAGCDSSYKVAHQDEAATLVYRDVYHDPNGVLPEIHWLFQDQMNCAPDINGVNSGFYIGTYYNSNAHIQCVAGVSWTDIGITQIGWPDSTKGLWDSAFSHELFHSYLQNTLGDPDPHHTNSGFGPPFHMLPGVVDYANGDLMYEGW